MYIVSTQLLIAYNLVTSDYIIWFIWLDSIQFLRNSTDAAKSQSWIGLKQCYLYVLRNLLLICVVVTIDHQDQVILRLKGFYRVFWAISNRMSHSYPKSYVNGDTPPSTVLDYQRVCYWSNILLVVLLVSIIYVRLTMMKYLSILCPSNKKRYYTDVDLAWKKKNNDNWIIFMHFLCVREISLEDEIMKRLGIGYISIYHVLTLHWNWAKTNNNTWQFTFYF